MSKQVPPHSLAEWIPNVSQLYKVLGDNTRLRILTLLLKRELNVSEICAQLGLEQSTVSHQLRVLRENHIVTNRREGKIVYYSLEDQHVRDILVETFTHVAHTAQE
ncbi:ArsR/SmtB family transcription factor [Vagococcus zengguangii]|uniref:Helix-turn-helix transcriptional regulator n=1 Tax=Vagococcus zengguangii TaxID=2571750 RepID=A0A4D7CNY4_9ENTE|nr:metalloregulator ArsR/SmtB family transcription factor [Vagococcus zengguangii]QCI85795.1 helix-turn-helix transcriptional regulator [Vagococcus zengguangii]TLG81736.1 helix-turn-helix transcriptional regulator [Vagococcus zengguangii]